MLNNAEKVFLLEREIGKQIGVFCDCRDDTEALNIRLDIDSMLNELRSVLNSAREEEEAFDRLFFKIESVSKEDGETTFEE